MTKDAGYWDRKSRREKVICRALGWLYLPLVLTPLLFPSVYYGFPSPRSTLVGIVETSTLVMLFGLCPACFLWLQDRGRPNSLRKLVYAAFALIYLVGNFIGLRGTVWYWSHFNLMIFLFFARADIEGEIENKTLEAGSSLQWLDKAVALVLIAAMGFHVHWHTWKWLDILVGAMLSVLAITSPSARQDQEAKPVLTKRV